MADVVLIAHALFVLFVVGGFAAVWLGHWRGQGWVKNRRFRLLHLAAIGFVAVTSLIGVACPLTILEDGLRGGDIAPDGFIQRWVGRVLYYHLPAWAFTAVYIIFALAVILTWRLIPPREKR